MLKIIISPAKKMVEDADSMECMSLPYFSKKAAELANILQSMNYDQLKKLWRCNDDIARKNYDRLHKFSLEKNTTPAILSYDGIQYKYMAPSVFDTRQIEYIQNHLFILSGFYGALRPFDGVSPYRLEMCAKLKTENFKNLYDYWVDSIYNYIIKPGDVVVNLASDEYSKVITKYKNDDVQIINCIFAETVNGKIIEKGTKCKMARGEMVRFMAENNITNSEDMKKFNRLDYGFRRDLSDSNNYCFIRQKRKNNFDW